jgi:CspA family cold shock protein
MVYTACSPTALSQPAPEHPNNLERASTGSIGKIRARVMSTTPHPSDRPARLIGHLFSEGKRTTTMSMNGTIKRLVNEKGFGFVAAADGSEYFFHQSAVAAGNFDQLREGQSVTFDTGQGPKGPRAENVRVA